MIYRKILHHSFIAFQNLQAERLDTLERENTLAFPAAHA